MAWPARPLQPPYWELRIYKRKLGPIYCDIVSSQAGSSGTTYILGQETVEIWIPTLKK